VNKEFQQGCQEYRENWWPVQVRKFLPPSKSMIAQSFPNARGEKTWKSLVQLSTLAGTILAIYTLLGVVFFVHVAPQLH